MSAPIRLRLRLELAQTESTRGLVFPACRVLSRRSSLRTESWRRSWKARSLHRQVGLFGMRWGQQGPITNSVSIDLAGVVEDLSAVTNGGTRDLYVSGGVKL